MVKLHASPAHWALTILQAAKHLFQIAPNARQARSPISLGLKNSPDACPVALVHTVAPAPAFAHLAPPDSGRTKSVRGRRSSASHVLQALLPPLLEQPQAARVWPVLQASTAVLKAAPCAVPALLVATAPLAASQATELRVRRERIRSIQRQEATSPASCVHQARTAPVTALFLLSHVLPMEAASLQLLELKTLASAEM